MSDCQCADCQRKRAAAEEAAPVDDKHPLQRQYEEDRSWWRKATGQPETKIGRGPK